MKEFVYLGITFTTEGSFKETHKVLSGQALKAIFKLNQYLYHFTDLSPSQVLDLFDKLIKPILCYGAQVWVFSNVTQQCFYNFVKKNYWALRNRLRLTESRRANSYSIF